MCVVYEKRKEMSTNEKNNNQSFYQSTTLINKRIPSTLSSIIVKEGEYVLADSGIKLAKLKLTKHLVDDDNRRQQKSKKITTSSSVTKRKQSKQQQQQSSSLKKNFSHSKQSSKSKSKSKLKSSSLSMNEKSISNSQARLIQSCINSTKIMKKIRSDDATLLLPVAEQFSKNFNQKLLDIINNNNENLSITTKKIIHKTSCKIEHIDSDVPTILIAPGDYQHIFKCPKTIDNHQMSNIGTRQQSHQQQYRPQRKEDYYQIRHIPSDTPSILVEIMEKEKRVTGKEIDEWKKIREKIKNTTISMKNNEQNKMMMKMNNIEQQQQQPNDYSTIMMNNNHSFLDDYDDRFHESSNGQCCCCCRSCQII